MAQINNLIKIKNNKEVRFAVSQKMNARTKKGERRKRETGLSIPSWNRTKINDLEDRRSTIKLKEQFSISLESNTLFFSAFLN
jgi:hypothetical protein